MKRFIKKLLPAGLWKKLQPIYHWKMALLAAIWYGFPARKIKIIGITGTKGKTTTAELINSVLEAAGYKTALAGTLRFKIDDKSEPNLLKMSMPGRFFLQNLISRAVKAKCDWLVVEMTSEGAKLYRHNFIYLDALVFTNISPEHIESHGSYEKYLAAKLSLAKALEKSPKKNKAVIANGDDPESEKFLNISIPQKIAFHLEDANPYEATDSGVSLTWQSQTIHSPLPGLFNIYNILAAASFAKSQGISDEAIKAGIEKLTVVAGRAEKIKVSDQQNFDVIVDYAHTADSLTKIYEAFGNRGKIGVLGSCGGGRDQWKRPEMGKVADRFCQHIILTNEDPYDEDPQNIINCVSEGISDKNKLEIIMDRREAIAKAISLAQPGEVVIITGKGTDPFIMGPNDTKIPWSDAQVAREELKKVLG